MMARLIRRGRADPRDIARTFLRWTFARAICHRGYVLVAFLYFAVEARLTPSQLLWLATVMAVALLLTDIPLGSWADARSRKWTLVAGHGFLAAGMIMTGFVASFPLLIVTQVLWALGWAFSGGADVAWINDELNEPNRIDRVLMARARWDMLGSATGMVIFGGLAWASNLSTAIVISGIGMAVVGMFVAATFSEDNFHPVRERRFRAAAANIRRSVSLARGDREIFVILLATLIINGASQVGWLFPKRLVDLGLPGDPVLAYSVLAIAAFSLSAIALHIVEARIHGAGVARRTYVLACWIGVLGLAALAYAPNILVGGVGLLLAEGIALNVARAVSVIWVNRRVTSDVRATMHSFLSQAESVGEILGGLSLALVAQAAGMSTTLAVAAGMIAFAGILVARRAIAASQASHRTSRAPRRPTPSHR